MSELKTFWIQYGANCYGEWEEIEAKNLQEADDEAYRLAMQEAESEIYCQAVDKMPDELK